MESLWIQQHGGLYLSQTVDDQDEFIGALSLGTAQEEDLDVRAVDRFHGLRVAHPLEAHKMGQGITVGRDASCSLVVDQPSVSCSLCTILPVTFGKVAIWGYILHYARHSGKQKTERLAYSCAHALVAELLAHKQNAAMGATKHVLSWTGAASGG